MFTRKPDSPAALELKRLGAELVAGILDDLNSIKRPAQSVETVFAMSTPFEAGMEAETRKGRFPVANRKAIQSI
ncbi:MAG: NmrA family NAD(P)-binding protein [bacterium]